MVLDEADVMLKLGFKEDVDRILAKCREVCSRRLQIALFSATVPQWVNEIAREHMKPNFTTVDLAKNLENKTAKNVRHLAIDCPFHNRLEALSKVRKYPKLVYNLFYSRLLWWQRANHRLHLNKG